MINKEVVESRAAPLKIYADRKGDAGVLTARPRLRRAVVPA